MKLKPTDLRPAQLAIAAPSAAIEALADAVRSDGGAVLSIYKEPLGGHTLLLAALPIEAVAPTPFQRDVSDAHVRRLTHAMDKTKRFLDPVIAVREERAGDEAKYWVPNGYHRLTALKELGAKSVIALVVPETSVAYQILALNIEKAHNLREKALGVVRMYRDLHGCSKGGETEFALEFEEPALVTLGFGYEKRPRLSGGAYHPALRRVDDWLPGPLRQTVTRREELADALLALDDAVGETIEKLKARGFKSPYLRSFVVARVNPLRFMKDKVPRIDDLLATMTKRARGMDAAKVRPEDVARTGGAPDAIAE